MIRRCLAFVALFALAACSDGGVGGTGIQSVVQGNVKELIMRSRGGGAAAQCGGLACIRVTVTGHDEINDQADEAGNFELVGVFPQRTTLEFYRREQKIGEFDLLVPAGAVVTVTGVEVGEDVVVPPDEATVVLDNAVLVDTPDCNTDPIALMVTDGSGNEFAIDLLPEDARDCDLLCQGSTVDFEAAQAPGATRMLAHRFTLDDPGPGCLP